MMFLKIFRRFQQICKMLSEGRTNVSEHFPNFFENFRRLTRKIRLMKIDEEDPMMFRPNIDLLSLIQHLNMANLSQNVSKSIS